MSGHNDDLRKLATTIRSARNEQSLSLYALADHIDVNRSSILRLERAEIARPSPEFLKRLAAALDLNLSDLFHLAGHIVPEDLPDFEIYLRKKHKDLPEPAIQQLKDYFSRIKHKYDRDASGPAPGEDENEAADDRYPAAA